MPLSLQEKSSFLTPRRERKMLIFLFYKNADRCMINQFRYLFAALCLGLTCVLHAQPLRKNIDGIPVLDQFGTRYASPFLGGITTPRFQFVPLFNTDKNDLVIFNGDAKLMVFRNTGSAIDPTWTPLSDLSFMPAVNDWFRFYDFDGDGKQDLLKETGFGLGSYYRNTGTATAPQFTLTIDTLRDNSDDPVTFESLSVPTVADIDADGKGDIFTGNSIGTINQYQNVSPSATALRFQKVSGQFACISAPTQDTIFIEPNCGGAQTDRPPRTNTIMHGSSALCFADLDGNGTLDLLFGDLSAGGIHHLRNIGTMQNPAYQVVGLFYPMPSPLVSTGFNLSQIVDVDGDGLRDLLVGVLRDSQKKDDFVFFKNIATNAAPQYLRLSDNFLSTFDVGINARPAFGDLNADGRADLILGNGSGEIALYRNVGTATQPQLHLQNPRLFFLDGDMLSPTLADIDADGDLDMVVGRVSGAMRFYRNTGTPQSPQFTAQSFPSIDTVSIANVASPTFSDVDNDGDMDLIVGYQSGDVIWLRNTGTPQNPVFARVAGRLAQVGLLSDNPTAAPNLIDIDGDGKKDLFVGTTYGTVSFFLNTGTPQSPAFTLQSATYESLNIGKDAAPFWIDINNDGRAELFIGTRRGGLELYDRNSLSVSRTDRVQPKTMVLAQNYPNPFNPSTEIRYQVSEVSDVRLEVFDMLGRKVATLVNERKAAGSYQVEFNATRFASGMYFYTLTAGGFSKTRKMMLVK
jgi:hypothetical protein